MEVNEKRPVSIITTELEQDVPCRVTVVNPKNATEELPTTKTPEGHETTFAPTEIGPHKVKVECAGKELPDSPFTVQVEKKILRIAVTGLDKRKCSQNIYSKRWFIDGSSMSLISKISVVICNSQRCGLVESHSLPW